MQNKDVFELIQIAGQKALFVDCELSEEDIPAGMHTYYLRSFFQPGAITILTNEPIDFHGNDILTSDNGRPYTSLGKQMTIEEFYQAGLKEKQAKNNIER